MNVLFVTDTNVPHLGGKSSHICDLSDGLKVTGNCTYIISALSVQGVELKKAKIKKVFLQPIKLINKWSYSRQSMLVTDRVIQKYVKEYLSNNPVDLISAQDPASALYSYEVVGDRIPITLTMHSYFGKGMSDISFDPKAMQHFDLIRERDVKSIDCVKAIIGVDTRIKNDCESYVKARKMDLPVYAIPNFVNTDVYNPASEDEKSAARKRLGIDPAYHVAICIRRLVDKNGVIYAVKAFEKVEGAVLLVGGDGPNREGIQSFIFEHHLEDKVKLMGGVQGKIKEDMYKAADYAIVPSITVNGLQEATSISAIEAMACGHVLIASSIGGLKELVQDGVNGILVDEQSEEQIAEAINGLIQQKERADMIKSNARTAVIENYSHIAGAKRYLAVFEKAIER